jgi:N-acetyl-alpha-D-glucosaminyl L-malate synthase BshA
MTKTSRRPLKIGIACYPTYGGSGVVATELGNALAEHGHEVHFLAYSRPPRLSVYKPRIFTHLVEVTTYPLFKYPPYDLALASKMMEVIDDVALDVLHVHYAIPHAISAYLARQMLPNRQVRIVTTLHGTDITLVGSGRAYREVTRFGIENSDCVVAVSESLRQDTLRIFGVSKPIAVIPNFIDTKRFAPQPDRPRPCFLPENVKVVVHVSNFRAVKRVGETVQAFGRIAAEIPSVLVLVGDGPDVEDVRALVRDLDLNDRVFFLGPLDDVQDILAIADVFLMSSEMESFGLSALEAMACGVPVVAYNVGGLGEVVTNGETGYLVRFGSVSALAARAMELLQDSNTRAAFGARARQTAVEKFEIARVLSAYEDLYYSALDSLRPAPSPT